jgi:hypothetical protein
MAASPKQAAKNRRYGHAHRSLRARLTPLVETGDVRCVRCKTLIGPAHRWDLDHTPDGQHYLGPSHRRCNRGEPSKRRRGKQTATAPKVEPRLRWTRVWSELVPEYVELWGNDARSVALRRKRGY